MEIQRLRVERQAEMQAFYAGSMTGEARDSFIAELKTQRDVRLATILHQYIQYEHIPPHKGSSADWEKVRLRFYDWGRSSPGSSHVAGIETRQDIVEERHGYPSRIRRILGRIDLSVPVNIPFVFENQERVDVNERRVSRAESRMSRAGVAFDDEGMNAFTDMLFEMLGGGERHSRSLPSYFNEPVVPRTSE
jgi:hypothetical protein